MQEKIGVTEAIIIFNTVILSVSLLLSVFFVLSNRKSKLYLYNFGMWFGLFVTHLLQGVFNNTPQFLPVAFSVSIFSNLILAQIFLSVHHLQELRAKPIYVVNAIVTVICFGLSFFIPFSVHAFPICLAIGLPYLLAFYKIIKADRLEFSPPGTVIGLVIAVVFFHNLDYPFLRLNPEFAPFGFIIATFGVLVLSLAIPIAINEKDQKSQKKILEKQVEQRTEELRQMESKVRSLLRTVCHDIANPISVLTYIQKKSLREIEKLSKEGPKQIEWARFEEFYTQKELAISQIKEILDLARTIEAVDSGKINLKKQSVDLKEIIEDTLIIFHHRMEAQNIQLHLDLSAEKALISKPVFSNIIFSNIISNAIKFTDSGGEIHVSVKGTDDKVRIEIRDTGVGIPKKLLPSIFDPNAKTSRAGLNGEDGTGFGMPLVKKFVEELGGSIEIQSTCVEDSNEGPYGTLVRLTLDSSND